MERETKQTVAFVSEWTDRMEESEFSMPKVSEVIVLFQANGGEATLTHDPLEHYLETI